MSFEDLLDEDRPVARRRLAFTPTPSEHLQALDHRLAHTEALNERLLNENCDLRQRLHALVERMSQLERVVAGYPKPMSNGVTQHDDKDDDDDDAKSNVYRSPSQSYVERNDDIITPFNSPSVGSVASAKGTTNVFPSSTPDASAPSAHGYMTVLVDAISSSSSPQSSESPESKASDKRDMPVGQNDMPVGKGGVKRVSPPEPDIEPLDMIRQRGTSVSDTVEALIEHFSPRSILSQLWQHIQANKVVHVDGVWHGRHNGWCALCLSRDVKQCHPLYLYDICNDEIDQPDLLDVYDGAAPDGYVDDVCYELIQYLQRAYICAEKSSNTRLLSIVERMPIFQDKRICLDVNDDG